jgi:hypothetical protein
MVLQTIKAVARTPSRISKLVATKHINKAGLDIGFLFSGGPEPV